MFEGISTTITQYEEIKDKPIIKALQNIKGNWEGEMIINKSENYKIRLELKQTNAELEGTMNVCECFLMHTIL